MQSFRTSSGNSAADIIHIAKTAAIRYDGNMSKVPHSFGRDLSVFKPKRLLSYVVASDTGLAPNIDGRVCSLAVCKPKIRAAAEPGKDWVIGLACTEQGRARVTYVMPVHDKISFDAYHRTSFFPNKKPTAKRPQGDNFFQQDESGRYRVMSEFAAHGGNPEAIAKDLSAPFVLLGYPFWYFGDKAPELPLSLADHSLALPGLSRRGHRTTEDAATIAEFVTWLTKTAKPGIYGHPFHGKPACRSACGGKLIAA